MHTDQLRELIDDTHLTDPAGHINGQTRTRILINDGQALEHLAAGATVKDEVIGPDVVALLGCHRSRSSAGRTTTASLLRHLQVGAAPPSPGPIKS